MTVVRTNCWPDCHWLPVDCNIFPLCLRVRALQRVSVRPSATSCSRLTRRPPLRRLRVHQWTSGRNASRSELQLLNTVPPDSGFFSCVAQNGHGSARLTVSLEVEGGRRGHPLRPPAGRQWPERPQMLRATCKSLPKLAPPKLP